MKQKGRGLCLIGVIGFVLVAFLPSMGVQGLVKWIAQAVLVLMGIRGIIMWFDGDMKEKQLIYAQNNVPFPKSKNAKNKLIHILCFFITIGAVLSLGLGIWDMISQKSVVTLTDCMFFRENYLEGIVDGSVREFRVEGWNDDEKLQVQDADEVVVTYYPHTKIVYSIEVQ